ncbi:MAG: hypothetical protein ACLGI6_15975 [Gammaproteobacteria bacterium]
MRPAALLSSLLLVCAGAQAQTAYIGRLFTSPAERHQLDVARGVAPAPPPPPVALAAPPPPAPAPVTINGVVKRSGGPSTVWMNSAAQSSQDVGGPARTPQVTVTLPGGQRMQIKPGQTVDMSAGSVKDVDTP